MEAWVTAEIELLRRRFPDLEIRDDLWCRFPTYALPAGIWSIDFAEVAFQIPAGLPGAQPYGFWVRPSPTLGNGGAIGNFTPNVAIAFGEGWGQFSWSPETWAPSSDVNNITKGTNMVNFVESFAARLREAS